MKELVLLKIFQILGTNLKRKDSRSDELNSHWQKLSVAINNLERYALGASIRDINDQKMILTRCLEDVNQINRLAKKYKIELKYSNDYSYAITWLNDWKIIFSHVLMDFNPVTLYKKKLHYLRLLNHLEIRREKALKRMESL